MKIEIMRTDGTHETVFIARAGAIGAIHRLIGASGGDTVNLRDGRVMCVDDTGLIDGRPVNKQATAIYHAIYPRAKEANRPICGDVAIAIDEDFA